MNLNARSGLMRIATAVGALTLALQTAQAGPINTNVAFTPRAGGGLLRLQYVYGEAEGVSDNTHVSHSGVRATLVLGVTANVAVFLSLPYQNVQVDLTADRRRTEVAHDGLGDVNFLVKYRFWQHDAGPQETYRWAVLAGLEIRSGDLDFSSDSYDPMIGTVFSFRRDRVRLDVDVLYKFNTGRDPFRHDVVRYDLAYSFRVVPAVFAPGQLYSLDAVAELNGRYVTDGSHEIFLSPGLQLSAEQWTFEASIQIPVVQDLVGDGPETDYRIVTGLRFHW